MILEIWVLFFFFVNRIRILKLMKSKWWFSSLFFFLPFFCFLEVGNLNLFGVDFLMITLLLCKFIVLFDLLNTEQIGNLLHLQKVI